MRRKEATHAHGESARREEAMADACMGRPLAARAAERRTCTGGALEAALEWPHGFDWCRPPVLPFLRLQGVRLLC